MRGRLVVLGAVVVAVAGIGGVAAGAGDDRATVTAMFADASPLVVGNVVKAAGVDVGTVDAIAVDHGKAKVRLSLDRTILPLHDDARATITTQDLLGERFVSLDRGTPDAPVLAEPVVLRETQTNRVVDLQDVLNAVDTPTGTALAALLTSTGEGVRGQGKQAAAAIDALAPAMRHTGELAGILSDQNTLLTTLVDDTTPVANALATGDGRGIDELVDATTDTLAVVAENQQAVQESLTRLPATMASARTTLAQLAGVADPATRTLASLRPVTDDLTAITGELHRFADAADPALAALPPVLDRADALLDEAAPLVRALRPATADLRDTAGAVRTLSDQALSLRLGHLMEFVKGWALATSDYDAISHYFKAMVPLSPKAIGDLAAGLVPTLPDQPVPDLPLPAPPELPLPGKGDAPAAGDQGSATGLTERQENSMLEQLLGGVLGS